MSISLPNNLENCCALDSDSEECKNRVTDDIFLSATERYEVYEVKTAERPHLLLFNDDDGTSCTDNGSHSDLKPLLDGCDIRGWRRENMVECGKELQGGLNIGVSSTMFRRESQWPLCNLKRNRQWSNLKEKLLNSDNIHNGADVIHHNDYKKEVMTIGSKSATKFALDYEEKNVPAIILGATVGWKCMPAYSSDLQYSPQIRSGGWTFSNLLSRFADVNWRFSDTHGEMMTLRTYAKYISNLEGITDDSPLGIYDSEFGEDYPTNELLKEYDVPSCFSPDLFELAKQNDQSEALDRSTSRPPYRWILIGPERSGTGMHVDPLFTNAFVSIIQGKKRWMLFPPSVPQKEIGMVEGTPQINSATWFKIYYAKVTSDEWPDAWRPIEVIQKPGQTVFVPNGWPHVVLNLELTVAVTHNYASEHGPFERMWQEVETEEPEFAERWLKGLKEKRQDLFNRVINLSKGLE